MNVETTGLTLTEWIAMIGLTVMFGGWAYFDHHVLVLGPYGRVDPILLASMLTPGVFLLLKHGETYLRARGQQVLTSLGLIGITKFVSQTGGGSIEMVRVDIEGAKKIAMPKLLPLRCGISKPPLGTISSRPRYIFGPEKHMIKFGGCIISQSDMSRFDAERHDELLCDIRDKMTRLPGVTLDVDSVIYGDNLGGDWPRLMEIGGDGKLIYAIPSTPDVTYNTQDERSKNRHLVSLQKLRSKLNWSVGKLRGEDWLGGL